MCAIVDANVAPEVFGVGRPAAGKKFFEWINKGSGRLVVGGELLKELDENSPGFREWFRQALLSGSLKEENDQKVNSRTESLRAVRTCRSNDPHIVALAQVSGARLLYSNDKELHQDFGNGDLIRNPRGKVYSTLRSKDFKRSHKQLLRRKDLCGIKR